MSSPHVQMVRTQLPQGGTEQHSSSISLSLPSNGDSPSSPCPPKAAHKHLWNVS